MAITSLVPGVRVAAPRDGARLRELFREAIEVDDGPTVVRFPKGNLLPDMEAVAELGDGVDVLHYSDVSASTGAASGAANESVGPDVLIVSIGVMSARSLEAARTLEAEGYNVTVVDPRWVAPVPQSLLALAGDHDVVVTVEDGIVRGGIGSMIEEAMSAAEIDTPLRRLGFPRVFPKHASRGELLADVGLSPEGIANSVREWADNLRTDDATQ